MQWQPEIQMPIMIKVMSEVIIPAIDPTNELAASQARLVIDHLASIGQNLPLQYRADRDELDRLVAYASDIRGMGEGDERLDVAIDSAADVLDRARAEPRELVEAIHTMAATLEVPVLALAADDPSQVNEALMRATLDLSDVHMLQARTDLFAKELKSTTVPADGGMLSPLPMPSGDEAP